LNINLFNLAISKNINDPLLREIVADYLSENGYELDAQELRIKSFKNCVLMYSGSGFGSGFNYGHSYNYGYDFDFDYGNYSGYNYGHGGGAGPGLLLEGHAMPEVGKRQMIVTGPLNMVFCGDVTEQIGPFNYRIANAFMIQDTGCGIEGWPLLAKGEGRENATFIYYGEITVGPEFGPCMEWVGELPKN